MIRFEDVIVQIGDFQLTVNMTVPKGFTTVIGQSGAGKSTLLAAVTRARPKIADYPFTTIHPNLGVGYVDGNEIIIADIPGLIEGAHEGAGLGARFLGHVERCGVLIHLIDGTQYDVAESYLTIRRELEAYDDLLSAKMELIVINKIDALRPEVIRDKRMSLSKISGKEVFTISGVAGTNLEKLFEVFSINLQIIIILSLIHI